MKDEERKRLLSKHRYKVFFDEKDNRWKTTLPDETKKNGRRLVAKKDKHKLEDSIIEYYSSQEDDKYIKNNLFTLEKIFPEWLKYKSSQTNATSYAKHVKI